jgi:hypothetical protein
MLAHLSRHGSDPRTAARQAGARLRRAAAVLAAVTCGLLGWAAAVPAAFATPTPWPPPGGQDGPVPVPATIVRVVTIGGMAGWQITLIAAGAALAAAATVMLIYRARASRPMQNVPAPATASAYDKRVLSGSDQIQFLSGAGLGKQASGRLAHIGRALALPSGITLRHNRWPRLPCEIRLAMRGR